MSDRIMVMHRGKVEQIGTPFEIYSDPKSLFVADFIGQANIISGKVLSAEGGVLSVSLEGRVYPVRGVKGETFSPGMAVSVVVRPESIAPAEEEGIAGTISTATFLGGRMEYEVLLPSGQTILSFDPYQPGKKTWREGEAVNLSFEPSSAVALPPEQR